MRKAFRFEGGFIMTLYEAMHGSFSLNIYLELLLRLIVSSACGIIIGVERSRRFKDAGVRTHFLVAFAASLIMIVSKYAFVDLLSDSGSYLYGARGADPARIAAQVVSGVSFLGAGIIFRDKHHAVKGLTTAAGIWAAAGVGLAIGSGMYYMGLTATVIVVVLQLLMHKFAIGNDRYTAGELKIVLNDDKDTVKRLHQQLDDWKIVISESNITREDGKVTFELKVKLPSKNIQDQISAFIAADPDVHSFKYEDWG